MTDRKKALEALLEKVDAGVWGIGTATVFAANEAVDAARAYHGSLDAAKALHEAVLPDWSCALNTNGGAQVIGPNGERWHGCKQDAPSRSWLIAILKALIEQEGGE